MRLTEKHGHRHPAALAVLRWLEPNPNLPDGPRQVADLFADMADNLLSRLVVGDGPELTTGLRRLVEAKDCMVRQAIVDDEAELSRSGDGI